MKPDCTFTPQFEAEAAQVVAEALPTGAAGGASLVPAPGMQLTFDRADGRLARFVVDVGEHGRTTALAESAADFVGALFGEQAAVAIKHALHGVTSPFALRAQPRVLAALSRLACLDAARLTSPVQSSPLWAVEAALLAKRAGLHCRAITEARRIAAALGGRPDAASPGDAVARPPVPPVPITRGEPGSGESARDVPHWLDPGLVPAGLFRHGLSPESDLHVSASGAGSGVIVAEAALVPGADPVAAARCVARFVDSLDRRVLAASPFQPDGRMARAELRAPAGVCGSSGMWVEVVGDERQPVQGTRMRQIRRSLRWADAALRAEGRPAGLTHLLGGGQWAALAAGAWERCSTDWSNAGDADRGYLAAARRAACEPGSASPEPPSSWAAQLAQRPVPAQRPYLAESQAADLPSA